MLVLETVLKIRREHAAGKAIKAIARDLNLSRKVVRKAIRAPEADFSYRRAVQPLPRIGPFQERLDTLLEEDEARPRREKLRITRRVRARFLDECPLGRLSGSRARSRCGSRATCIPDSIDYPHPT